MKERESQMYRTRLILLLCTASLLAACQEPAQDAPEVRPVRTMIADPRPIPDDRRAIGEIRPRQESELGFLVSGKIVQRAVDAGALVKKGDLIARIEDADYRNKLKAAEADYAAADAAVVESRGAEDRARTLLAQGSTTRVIYESAVKNLRSGEAKVESTKASLELARDQLRYTELRAEFDGVVTAIGAEVGQVVSSGKMIVKLAPPEAKDAVFTIAESVFGDGRADERPDLVVSLLSHPDVTADGQLREISPIADPNTRTYQVKVTLKDPPDQMRFGASIVGRRKGETTPCVVLPAAALFDKAGEPAVWIVEKGGELNLKNVTVARYESDRVVVSDGLAKGDVVVTAGVNRLRERQKVRIAHGGPQ
jgi:RND family efflux transporter MFP subunit